MRHGELPAGDSTPNDDAGVFLVGGAGALYVAVSGAFSGEVVTLDDPAPIAHAVRPMEAHR